MHRFVETNGASGASLYLQSALAKRRKLWMSADFVADHPGPAALINEAIRYTGGGCKWRTINERTFLLDSLKAVHHSIALVTVAEKREAHLRGLRCAYTLPGFRAACITYDDAEATFGACKR